MAAGTIGTRAVRTAKPRPFSLSHACTPDAASRPKAEPPASAMASMPSTVCAGSSRAVSRVPGPPPRKIDRADNRFVEHDCGGAGAEPSILGMADIHPRNVGDLVAQDILASSGNGDDFSASVNRSHPRGRGVDGLA